MKGICGMSLKNVVFCGVLVFLVVSTVNSHVLDRTAFVIMSQEAHENIAENTRKELRQALRKVGVENPHVALLHKDLPSHGGWTIFPILAPLLKDYHNLIDWFVFLDEAGAVDPKMFAGILEKYDPDHDVFLGKALQDQDSVIIHHYDQNFDFKYPDFAAGFVLSVSLAEALSEELDASDYQLEHFPSDFSIGNEILQICCYMDNNLS